VRLEGLDQLNNPIVLFTTTAARASNPTYKIGCEDLNWLGLHPTASSGLGETEF
jgi:hypothetical protein